MQPYTIRVTRLTVVPDNQPIFSEMATHFTIDDEAAGEYIEIQQQAGSLQDRDQKIAINPEEWPFFKDAIETLLAGMREEPKGEEQ